MTVQELIDQLTELKELGNGEMELVLSVRHDVLQVRLGTYCCLVPIQCI